MSVVISIHGTSTRGWGESQGVEVIITSVVGHCFNHASRQSQIRGLSDRSMRLSWKKSEFVSIMFLVYQWICCYIYVAVVIVNGRAIFTHIEATKMSLLSWALLTNCSRISATLPNGWLVTIDFDNRLVLSSIKPLPKPVLIQIFVNMWHE